MAMSWQHGFEWRSRITNRLCHRSDHELEREDEDTLTPGWVPRHVREREDSRQTPPIPHRCSNEFADLASLPKFFLRAKPASSRHVLPSATECAQTPAAMRVQMATCETNLSQLHRGCMTCRVRAHVTRADATTLTVFSSPLLRVASLIATPIDFIPGATGVEDTVANTTASATVSTSCIMPIGAAISDS